METLIVILSVIVLFSTIALLSYGEYQSKPYELIGDINMRTYHNKLENEKFKMIEKFIKEYGYEFDLKDNDLSRDTWDTSYIKNVKFNYYGSEYVFPNKIFINIFKPIVFNNKIIVSKDVKELVEITLKQIEEEEILRRINDINRRMNNMKDTHVIGKSNIDDGYMIDDEKIDAIREYIKEIK